MTKMVRFTKDMAPYHAGDIKALPDELADKTVAAGEATHEPSIFDAQPRDKLRRPKFYLTRKGE